MELIIFNIHVVEISKNDSTNTYQQQNNDYNTQKNINTAMATPQKVLCSIKNYSIYQKNWVINQSSAHTIDMNLRSFSDILLVNFKRDMISGDTYNEQISFNNTVNMLSITYIEENNMNNVNSSIGINEQHYLQLKNIIEKIWKKQKKMKSRRKRIEILKKQEHKYIEYNK